MKLGDDDGSYRAEWKAALTAIPAALPALLRPLESSNFRAQHYAALVLGVLCQDNSQLAAAAVLQHGAAAALVHKGLYSI